MEIKGRIIHVMPLQSGIGQVSGKEWKKQEYVLETQEQYPVSVGDEVVVSFDLESREAKGRWYTDVRAWKIEKVQASAPAHGEGSVPPPPADFEPNAQTDDLPF